MMICGAAIVGTLHIMQSFQPRVLSENEMFREERAIVTRTVSTWLAIDGVVAIPIANLSSVYLTLYVRV